MMLKVSDAYKSYGTNEVLKGFDLGVDKGQVIALIGRSGSGKSTILRCINGLEVLDAGSVEFAGQVLRPQARESRRIRERIGFVFQQFNLFPHMSARENVAVGLRVVKKLSKGESNREALDALAKVGLSDKADARPASLSGGQQQRVAIARALAMKPELMLFDEPTSALDPELVGEVLLVIKDLAAEGRTMILATHEMRFAQKVADTVVYLEGGQSVAQGPPEYIFGQESPSSVRDFLRHIEHEV